MAMQIGAHWTRDPDHSGRRLLAPPAAPRVEFPAAGVEFPNGIDGARSDGTGSVLLDDESIGAARRRTVRAIGRASLDGLPAGPLAADLPAGIHAATHDEFARAVGGTARRAELLEQLPHALRALRDAGVRSAIVGGSLVGPKLAPGDIDIAWVANPATTTDSVNSAIAGVRELAPDVHVYRADRIMENAPTVPNTRPGMSFAEFFQHDRAGAPRGAVLLSTAEDTARAALAPEAARRSIMREALDGLRLLASIR